MNSAQYSRERSLMDLGDGRRPSLVLPSGPHVPHTVLYDRLRGAQQEGIISWPAASSEARQDGYGCSIYSILHSLHIRAVQANPAFKTVQHLTALLACKPESIFPYLFQALAQAVLLCSCGTRMQKLWHLHIHHTLRLSYSRMGLCDA